MPSVPRLGHGALEALDRPLVDHRAEEDVALGGIAHPDRAGSLEQPLDERRGHRRGARRPGEVALHFWFCRLNAERITPSAAASRSALGSDDRRVLAAQLQQARLDPARH